MKTATFRATAVAVLLISAVITSAQATCNYTTTWLLYGISSSATGQTKVTDDGHTGGLEYHGSENQADLSHSFWIECQ